MRGFTHESQHNESQEWYTPPEIFEALGVEFDLDPASPGREFVPWIPARRHFTREENGLSLPWNGPVWLNPPYGQQTPTWLKRFCEHGNGIALVFARTDTRWFHEYATRADGLLFVRGRIGFISAKGCKNAAPGTPGTPGRPGTGSLLLAFGARNNVALKGSKLGFFCRGR